MSGILGKNSSEWVEELIEASELNTSELISLEDELGVAIRAHEKAQEQWDAQYFEFLLNEDNYKETAGIKSWNDSKRLEFVKANWPNAWNNLEYTRRTIENIEQSLRVVKARISHINRVQRLLELVYGTAT